MLPSSSRIRNLYRYRSSVIVLARHGFGLLLESLKVEYRLSLPRHLINPGQTCKLSLFQLSRRWLKGVLDVAVHLLPHFKARLSNLILQPVLLH